MSAPAITESEWIVATIVWEEPGLTAAEITARLPKKIQWKLKTVNTFLTRLVAKEVLKTKLDGRAFRYHAAMRREQCVRRAGESFLQRVFGGAAAPLLAHFVETTELSDEEIAELRLILQRKANPPSKSKPSK